MSSSPIFAEHKDLLIMFVLDFINPTHSTAVSESLQKFLTNIEDLGSLGLFYLIFVFTMFFQDYEHIINKVYGAKKRAWLSTFILYVSFIIMIPSFLVIYTFLSTMIELTNLQIILKFLFGLTFMTLIFMISPNIKVSFKASFVAAFITVNVLKISQIIFTYYISYNEAFSTIYGTLSVIFFMFLWVYITWIIFLYGAKICHLLNTKEEAQ